MSHSAARDSSRYQKLLVEGDPSLQAYWDVDLRCRYANRACEHWFGVSPSSLVGTSLRDLLGPEPFALIEGHVRAVLAGQEQSFEQTMAGPGGARREGLATYTPDFVDGAVVGFLAQVSDVTALKAAQLSLAHSREYLQELLSLTTEGVVVADREGRCVDLNDALCEMLGYAREEILGKTFEDLLCPEELARLPGARAQLRAGERHVEEWALQRKDGSSLAAEVRASFLPDGRRVGYLRDITEHKRALASEREMADQLEQRVQQRTVELNRVNRSLQLSHETLQASELRYHTLVDWSPEAIAVHCEGRLAYVNRAAVGLFGAKSEVQLVGRPILDLIQPEFRDFALARMKSAAESGTPGPAAELGLVGLDGTRIDAEIQGIPIIYEGKASLMASIRDITARKRTELELGRSRARLRGIIDTATDAIITVDGTQTIVGANPAAAAMFRCALDAMVGAALEQFIPERHRKQHWRDVHDFGDSASGARHMGRTRGVTGLRAGGEEFPIDVSISHMNDEGKLLFTAILRDLTERRRIEGELQSGKATLEAALSSMSDAVMITDREGRVQEVNKAYARFHHCTDSDSGRWTLEEYLALIDVRGPRGEPVPMEQWPVSRALRGESADSMQYQLRRRDTGQSWIGSFTFSPILATAGEIVGSVITARDITTQMRAQAELESAHADLQRLIAAKDKVQEEERKRIARDLHDDLQQTLSAIRIDVGVIDQTLAAGPEAVAPILAKVDELASAAIQSARRIVNDLQPQVLEDLGLVPALETLAGQFTRRTGIQCELEALDATGDGSMESTPIATPLYRVAQEALNNVLKHAQATSVHLRLATAAGGNFVMRISDNGRGMSVADRRKAQSFGLLGMQERVRSLGGTLRIESQLGAGTAIEVVVPLRGPPRVLHDAEGGLDPGDKAGSMQDAIDALPGHIAVLDRDGVIRFVNRAWREFAQRNGDPGMLATGPDVNYLAVCRRSAQQDEQAAQVLKGLLDVLDGRSDEFMTAYPCHSPHERRWFLVRVAPTADGHVQVTHLEVGHIADVVRPQARPH